MVAALVAVGRQLLVEMTRQIRRRPLACGRLCSHGAVLYGTTRGAEALRFGIEAAGVDDAVAIVAARWVHYEVLSAVVWCTEHAAVLVGRASAEKAHLAPRTALRHFIVPSLSLLKLYY